MRWERLLLCSILTSLTLSGCQPGFQTAQSGTPVAPPASQEKPEHRAGALETQSDASTASSEIRSPPVEATASPPTEVPPTLTPEQQRLEVARLLKPTDDCRLPCWWDLVPDQTSWDEASAVLSWLGARILSTPVEGGRILHGAAGLNLNAEHIDIWLSIWERAGIVEEIQVTASGDRADAYYEPLFRQRLRPYFPDRVMERHGPPKEVGIALGLQKEISILTLELVLVYDGFEIHYQGAVRRGSQAHRLCPLAGQIGVIRMHLRPSSPTRVGPYFVPVELAAGLDPTGFYERFQSADAETCVSTPADLWP